MGEGQVLLDRGEWIHRGPAFPRLKVRIERWCERPFKDTGRLGCPTRLSKDIDRLGWPSGKRSSASRARTIASCMSSIFPSSWYQVERRIVGLIRYSDRSGCPSGRNYSASRSRTVATSMSSSVPSCSYRKKRSDARLFNDPGRSGCPSGQRLSASRPRTMVSLKVSRRSKMAVTMTEMNCETSQ